MFSQGDILKSKRRIIFGEDAVFVTYINSNKEGAGHGAGHWDCLIETNMGLCRARADSYELVYKRRVLLETWYYTPVLHH